MNKKILIDVIGLELIALVVIVGYKLSPMLLPKADVTVQPDPVCSLQREACSVKLPSGGEVSPGIEAGNLVSRRVTGGQDEDGHGLPPATGAIQHIHAGKSGQAEVKDDQVETLCLQGLVGRISVAQPVDGKAELAQTNGQAVAQFGIVFD